MEYLGEFYSFSPIIDSTNTAVNFEDETKVLDNDNAALLYFQNKYGSHLLSVMDETGRHIFIA